MKKYFYLILIPILFTLGWGVSLKQENQKAIASPSEPINLAQNQASNPLEGTQWQLVGWSESQPLTDKSITLSFIDKGMAGSAGCNRYQGSYKITEDTLIPNPLATTRMACPEPLMTQESLFLEALQGTKLYTINAKGQLQLVYRSKKGLGLMTFKPTTQTSKPKTEKTIYVSSKTVPCVGIQPQKCLQVKEKMEDKWTLFYESIEGFDYQPGYLYQLKVTQTIIPNPPADKSSIRWSLVEVISKTSEKKMLKFG